MKRDEKTADLIIGVTKAIKSGDRIAPDKVPNAATFLSDLQKEILHESASTGDELIDYLVGCYGEYLSAWDIARFHKLDIQVREAAGETALLVHRERARQRAGLNDIGPYMVRTTYYVGILGEGGLQTNLRQGSCVLPTSEHTRIRSLPLGEKSSVTGGILINKAFDPYSDDGLASIASIGLNIDLRNDPGRSYAKDAKYIDKAAKAEIDKGTMQIILGTEQVNAWIENDTLARKAFEKAS